MSTQASRDVPGGRPQELVRNVERVVFGRREAVTLAVVGLLAGGHVLLEDAPGTGKTTLARALARSVDLGFRRIQFTADLLPADVLGVSTPDPATGEFRFRPGPVFAHVVLADELNRTTPRTQSALLECMNAGQVTVDGVTRPLPRPFLVVATQNPLEFEGTYPLPESQLDRFLLRIRTGYPARSDERRVLVEHAGADLLETLEPVMDVAGLLAAQEAAKAVRVDDRLVEYVLDLVARTRQGGRFLLGLSPRAGIGMLRAARALAFLEDRDYCVPDDVKRLVVPVFAHRVVAARQDEKGGEADRLLAELAETVAVPT